MKNFGLKSKCPNVECDKKCKDEHKEKDDNGCTTCRCTKQLGDLLLTEAQINWIDDQEKSGDGSPRAASSVVKKWTRDVTADGYYRIPYNYSDDIHSRPQHRANIIKAISILNALTCLEFQPATQVDINQMYFIVDEGCWSYVGRQGGKQKISIDDGCQSVGTILHEIMHALGFWHEQSRSDRNDFVKVLKRNIESDKKDNFFKISSSVLESYNSAYDYKSVMHYNGYSFSKNGKPTLTNVRTGKAVVNQRIMLSREDQLQLRAMYNCKGLRKVPETTDCMHPLDQGASYRGTASVTKSGYTCQRWDRQSPHSHYFDPSHITGAGLENNYCRNPNLKNKPWCYSTNLRRKWEYCSIPICDNPVREIFSPHSPRNNRGFWSDWSEWGQCRATCGSGYQYRTHHCIGADVGSAQCPGEYWESVPCRVPCASRPASGDWQTWWSWSACDAVCVQGNNGHRYRVRACSSEYCEGDTIEEEMCFQPSCPTYDGNDCFNKNDPAAYRGTLAFAMTGATCIPWKRTIINIDTYPNADLRENYCRNMGNSDGLVCFVKKKRTKRCAPPKCRNNEAYWSDYSDWSACTVTCDGGFKYRTRTCIRGAISEGSCIGDVVQSKECNTNECGDGTIALPVAPVTHTPPSIPASTGSRGCVVLGEPQLYRGTVSKTFTSCLYWDSQTPHAHDYTTLEKFVSAGLTENYCRAPEADDSWPWCLALLSGVATKLSCDVAACEPGNVEN
ncbi:apolipoprotein(a)-like isoform X2 [Clavelina lepadiformis]|uniref:apolipoprotein(a)-like isoform X2 n=1 Tax=Clavelina lepadiformis TaxID=159417 RepID=UPI0040430056